MSTKELFRSMSLISSKQECLDLADGDIEWRGSVVIALGKLTKSEPKEQKVKWEDPRKLACMEMKWEESKKEEFHKDGVIRVGIFCRDERLFTRNWLRNRTFRGALQVDMKKRGKKCRGDLSFVANGEKLEGLRVQCKGYRDRTVAGFHVTMTFSVQMDIGKAMWERPFKRMTDFINKTSSLDLFPSEKFADVTIVCKDGSFKAHRIILYTRSKYFEAMFSHDTMENAQGMVKFPEEDVETMKSVVKYLYSFNSPKTSERTEELLVAAHKYLLPELKEHCDKSLAWKVNVSGNDVGSLCEQVLFATTYDATEILDRLACQSAGSFKSKVKRRKAWKTFEKDHPEEAKTFMKRMDFWTGADLTGIPAGSFTS